MANQLYGGYQVVGTMTGGMGVLPSTFMVEVANNYATALFQGDVLIPVSDGTCAIAAAADNGKLAYVANGFSYNIGGKRTPKPYLPANTTFSPTTVGSVNASHVEVTMIMPDVIFGVAGDDATTVTSIATAIAMIGENADLVTGTGNTTSGVSGMKLDISTHATTAANFRIVGIQQYPSDNPSTQFLNQDPTLVDLRYLVTCNEGFWPPYTTTGL